MPNSIETELQRLVQTDGVLAAACASSDRIEVNAPNPIHKANWEDLFKTGFKILTLHQTGRGKITIGDRLIVMESHGETIIGVAVVSGHPIMKSLRRAMRRFFQRTRMSSKEIP